MKKIFIFSIVALIISTFFFSTKTAMAGAVSFDNLGNTSMFMSVAGVQKFRDGNTVCYVVVEASGGGAGISCVRVK